MAHVHLFSVTDLSGTEQQPGHTHLALSSTHSRVLQAKLEQLREGCLNVLCLKSEIWLNNYSCNNDMQCHKRGAV